MMVSDWTLSICTAFFCLGAGLLAALSVSEFSDFSERTLKIGSVLSLLTLGLGSVLALSNLGRPEMILGVLRNPGRTFLGIDRCGRKYFVRSNLHNSTLSRVGTVHDKNTKHYRCSIFLWISHCSWVQLYDAMAPCP